MVETHIKVNQDQITVKDIIVESNYHIREPKSKKYKYKKHPLKIKYFGMQVSKMAVGHINPQTGEIEYNELVDHPTIKRIMRND